jgi:hypothetical protein
VAYDLRSFVDPATLRINLEPVIARLIGVVLLKRKVNQAVQAMMRPEEDEKDEAMEEEEKEEDTFAAPRIDVGMMLNYSLKERASAAVHAQCAFI